MGNVLRIPIPCPSMGGCLLLGKQQCIGFTISPVISYRPWYVPVSIVISLQRQFQLVHVLRAGASSLPDTVCIILHSNLYGIFRICNGSGAVWIPCIVRTFTGLHRIRSIPSGFLHHDRLYHGDIFGDSVLVGIFLYGCRIGKDFLAECFAALRASRKCRTANDSNHDNQ